MDSKRRIHAHILFVLLLATSQSAAWATPTWQQVDVVRNGEDGVTGLSNGYDLVMSADGRYAYTAAYGSSTVTVFSRDLVTGGLSQQQVLQNNIGGVSGIGATRALRLSPDGKFLYAAGTSSNAIGIFGRDEATGQLSFLSSYTYGGPLHGLFGVNAMNISNDGKFVYASSETYGSLNTFARDATTGALTFVEMLKNNSLITIRSFTISDDDRFLYAPARDANNLTQYYRDPTTGQLTVAQTLTNNSTYSGPTHISFSPDGKHAYLASQLSDTLTLFDVDSLSGNLVYKTTYHDNADGFHFLNHAEDIVVTADGQFVMVTATIDNALSVFLRDPVTGELTVYQEFQDGKLGIDGLFRARELYLSPDQRFLYVMSPEENAIAIFQVPEPTALWLAATGAIGVTLGAWIRRPKALTARGRS